MSRQTPSNTELAESLLLAARALGRLSGRASIGRLSNSRYDLLHTLFHRGPLSMRNSALALGVAPRSITDLVDALEGDGLIERSPHPDDRRSILLSITDAGLKMLEDAHRARLEQAGHMFDPLSQPERMSLLVLLSKLDMTSENPPRQR